MIESNAIRYPKCIIKATVAYWVNHCATMRANRVRFSVEVTHTELPTSSCCWANSALYLSEIGKWVPDNTRTNYLQLISDYLSYRKQRTKKSDICNFADDNTLFSHGSSLPLILNKIEHDMKNLLYRFKIQSLKANLRKFQLMILGKKNRLKYSLNWVYNYQNRVSRKKIMSHCRVQASCFKTNQEILGIR